MNLNQDGDTQQCKTPISEVIKQRLISKNLQFYANDTIHSCIEESEIALLKEEVEQKLIGVLESLVIDIEKDHNTKQTAKRIAKKYIDEIFKGRYQKPPSMASFPNAKKLDEIYTVGLITMRSTCAHHFVPIMDWY